MRELRRGSEVSLPRPRITPEQLERAVKVQRHTKEADLGRALIELGLVGEREVLQAKAQEQGIGYVDLYRVHIDEDALDAVPARIAKAHTVIPVKKDFGTLWLAMPDNKNIHALDDVQLVSGCRVVPVLAAADAIEDAILRYYN